MDDEACRALGTYLTGTEARHMADKLDAGVPWGVIRASLGSARGPRISELVTASGLSSEALLALLRAVEGAHSAARSITPVWTAPDNLVAAGQLTGSLHHYVDRARESVTCATYNVQRTSTLWSALKATVTRPEIAVRMYMDAGAAARGTGPTPLDVARELAPARVYRSATWNVRPVVTHAKFLAIDHQYLIVGSANVSWSAEQNNIELGFLIEDQIVARAAEEQMARLEPLLYERVHA